MSKSVIGGRVIEVGWENNSPHTERIYALIKVKIGTTRRKDLAEKRLQKLRKGLLDEKVVIFPEG